MSDCTLCSVLIFYANNFDWYIHLVFLLSDGGKIEVEIVIKSRDKHCLFFIDLFITECYLLINGYNLAYGSELHLERGKKTSKKKEKIQFK